MNPNPYLPTQVKKTSKSWELINDTKAIWVRAEILQPLWNLKP